MTSALAFAALVRGEIDPRTVSTDAFSAKRQALYWHFSISPTNLQTEAYIEFIWMMSVTTAQGRNPENTVEIVPVRIELDNRPVEPLPAPPEGETPTQREMRLMPTGPALAPADSVGRPADK